MSPMSTPEDDRARQLLREIVAEALRAPQERWNKDYGADPEAPSAPGTILRVPDVLLRRHGLDTPFSVVVLGDDERGVHIVPIRLGERLRPGEILVEEAQSPFLSGFCIIAWASFRIPTRGLHRLKALARAPAALEVALAIGNTPPPAAEWATVEKWKTLANELCNEP